MLTRLEKEHPDKAPFDKHAHGTFPRAHPTRMHASIQETPLALKAVKHGTQPMTKRLEYPPESQQTQMNLYPLAVLCFAKACKSDERPEHCGFADKRGLLYWMQKANTFATLRHGQYQHERPRE